ncbi:hypothetical protein [Pseudomonas sp. NBRC 111131]|nr:hypothetical protein [Pseudomonas sp. NBRC 111131]
MNPAYQENHGEPVSALDNVRLYFLDHGGNRVLSAMSDGSNIKVVVEEGCSGPDGIAIDSD